MFTAPVALTTAVRHTPVVRLEPLRLAVLHDPETLDRAWDDVVDRMARPSPFLKSWWLAGAAHGRPAVLVVTRGDELLGGAAFELDRIGRGPLGVERVRSLGQGALAPDHLDVVAASGDVPAVLDAVLAWLRGSGTRIVDLDGLAADGALASALAPFVAARTAAPFARFTDGIDVYLDSRPGKLRSTITRTSKRLAKAGATIGSVSPSGSPAEVRDRHARALDDLNRLHDERWAQDSGFLDAWTRFRAAALTGLERGDVRITEVTASDGTVVATELDLVCGDVVAFYQAGRRTDREWRGAGSALRSHILHEAASEGRTEYDLLRGDEAYKSDWSTGSRDLVRVRFGVGAVGRGLDAAGDAWRRSAPVIQSARTRVRRRLSRP